MGALLDSPVLQLTDTCFEVLRRLFEKESGILLHPDKKPLLVSRLQKRLEARGLSCFEDYALLLRSSNKIDERQAMVDALTTHETYFFREANQFQHFALSALPRLRGHRLRVWSAASSTGEEAYSIAMLLADSLGWQGWSLYGSDLSMRVVWHASRGLYPLQRLEFMPEGFLRKYCLQGQGDFAGYLLIKRELREQASFFCHNLLNQGAELGLFDVIFLRNVLIYFDVSRRLRIVDNAIARLRPGGYLYLGQSESLNETPARMELIGNAIYRRIPLNSEQERVWS